MHRDVTIIVNFRPCASKLNTNYYFMLLFKVCLRRSWLFDICRARVHGEIIASYENSMYNSASVCPRFFMSGSTFLSNAALATVSGGDLRKELPPKERMQVCTTDVQKREHDIESSVVSCDDGSHASRNSVAANAHAKSPNAFPPVDCAVPAPDPRDRISACHFAHAFF